MKRRIVLLHVIDSLGLGGAERFLVALCTALPQDRYQVIVSAVTGDGTYSEDLRQAGIELFPLRARSSWDLAAGLRLARFVRQRKVDIVHSHLFIGGVHGRLAGLLGGVRAIVTTEQNAYAPGQMLPRAQVLTNRILARFTDRLVAVSAGTQAYLESEERVSAERISVVPNAIPWPEPVTPDRVEQVLQELGAEGRSPIIGTVARLTEQKGHRYLLRALAGLRARFPAFVCLVVGDGELRRELEALAADLGLAGNVVFCGLRRDVPVILQGLDLFVLPSLFEGLPLALLEAMAAGKPVVATAVAGSSEVIEAGVNGLLVPPEDVQALTTAMASLLDDGELAGALAGQGRETVRQRYTIGPVAKAYDGLYRQVLGMGQLAASAGSQRSAATDRP